MTVNELLNHLRERGVVLAVKDDELVVQGKKQVLADADLVRRLRENKKALIELIREGGYEAAAPAEPAVPPNAIGSGCDRITPQMLPLVQLTQAHIDAIVDKVPGGAANVQDVYPLAPLQEGILFHHLMAKGGDVYLSPVFFAFETRERMDAFMAALQAVIARHDILRTAVLWEGLPEPVQVVWREARLQVDELPAEGLAGDVEQHLRTQHALERIDVREAPLMRATVAHDTAKNRWCVVLRVHHLATDQTTLQILQQEIQAHLLGHAALLPTALPFREFVARSRRPGAREQQETFFRRMLADVDETTAPYGLADVMGDGSGLGSARRELPRELVQALRQQARTLGVSAASLCHLAFAQVLARVSGRDDVVFGTLVLGRLQGGAGADRVLGPFINTLPVRIRTGQGTVEEAARDAHRLLAELMRHEQAPLSLAQRCSGVAALSPLFSALLNYRHAEALVQAPGAQEEQAWKGVEALGTMEQTHYPFSVDIDDFGEAMLVSAQVRAPADAQHVCGHVEESLRQLVEALAQRPASPAREIDVMPAQEKRQIAEGWNRTDEDFPRDLCLHQLFEQRAASQPDAVAIVDGDASVTYAELDARASRLARHLRSLGVGPDGLVALCTQRGASMVVGALAVLKAGGAYVPMDPSYPADRIGRMLGDCAPVAVLTGPGVPASVEARIAIECARGDHVVPVLDLLGDAARWAGQRAGRLAVEGLQATHLAYVIYTSGSTGEPKGVMVEHRSACNLVSALGRRIDLTPADRFLQFASVAFDVCVEEVFGTLAAGATLVVRDDRWLAGAREFWSLCERHGVTVVDLPTQFWSQLADDATPIASTVRQVLMGGEAVSEQALKAWFARTGHRPRLINAYGPTETTINATVHEPAGPQDWRVIGRPVDNTRIHLLDAHGRLVPVGAVGEMFVAGDGVARGYLRRPALSAERFVRDPFGAGRMYRTGDLARRRADGLIEFVGRNDFQVKVRGFRIEPGEVEAALRAQPGVKEAAVLAQDDPAGGKRLVAYCAIDAQAVGVDADALASALGTRLPDYMIPSAFVLLERMPLTASGKLDRKALPEPGADAFARVAYEPPMGELETRMAAVWAQVLGIERVGRHDDFFRLGGHSLLALRLVERMRAAHLAVDVRSLFDKPTVALLAAEVGAEQGLVAVPENGVPEGASSIEPHMLPLVSLTQEQVDRIVAAVPGGAANVQDVYPLAPLQEGILFHHLMAKEGDPYLQDVLLRFADRARLDAFVTALQAVIDRHDILRTAVLWEGMAEPVQVVWRHAPLDVREHVLDAAQGPVAEQLQQAFDPRRIRLDVRHAPMLQAHVAPDGEQGGWLMLLLFHHLSADHTALERMQHEIQAHLLGQADRLAAPRPFRNFVAQARLGVSTAQHEAFFREMLGDVDEPTAPFGFTDVRGDGSGIEEAHLAVDEALSTRLRDQARALGVTTASLVHLAWALVLGRISGRDDVVFGTLLFGRMQGGPETDQALGLFINTLPLRVRLGTESVREAVRGTHALLSRLLRHEHAPLALAQRCSAVPAPAPLFSALLNYRHSAPPSDSDAGSDASAAHAWDGIEVLRSEERTNYPLLLNVDDFGTGLGLTAQAQSPMDPQRICAFMHTALESLADALEQPVSRPVRSIEVLPVQERALLLKAWNATQADYPRDACIHDLVEAQVLATPDALAVVHGERSLSYAELDAQANRLAHHLRGRGVGPDRCVALCVRRSERMVIAMLAVLKAGGAYVPLDPAYPAERLAHMLEDSAPAVLIADGPLPAGLDWPAADTVDLQADAVRWASEPSRSPCRHEAGIRADHLAYVIYTSGSTGKPKGVAIEHRNAVNFICWAREAFSADELRRTLLSTSLNFDLAVYETFVPLACGATVEVVDNALALLRTPSPVSLVNTVPSALAALLDAGGLPPQVRTVNVAGEPLKRGLAEKLFARTGVERLCNLYGPSETTTYSTWVSMPREQGFAPHVGRPIANTTLYILDAHRRPVPVGVTGELYIGGDGVARGYLHRPELTAERFLPDPFNGGRMYKTGDLARYLPDGNVEFLGRNDFQVKIRGFRIELGEIEAALLKLPGVREAVVLAREDQPGDKRLVAYCVAGEGAEPEALKSSLAGRLPDHMVPAAFVVLDRMPLTPNGKLDRKALPAPGWTAAAGFTHEAPVGETETALAALWAELLDVDRVGRGDHFFDLGGHSLVAVRLVSRVREALGVEMGLGDLFAHPVLADLAAALRHARASALPPLGPVVRDGDMPLSSEQRRLWFLSQTQAQNQAYNVPLALHLKGALDVAALRRALDAIVARHESLRTSFPVEAGEPVQRISPADAGLALVEESCDELLLRELAAREAAAPFDLAQGPLVRARLVRVHPASGQEDEHVLLLTLHHIVCDGWSLGVLASELFTLYEAFGQGRQNPLPELPLQYADYAGWQRAWLDDKTLAAQASYWQRQLAGAPAFLELPTDRPRPARQDLGGATVPIELDAALSESLRALSRKHGATLFMTLLAGWAALLSRLSGQQEVVVGTPWANRGRVALEGIVGLFVNTLALRVDLGGDATVAQLLQRVKVQTLDAQQHADLPFEQVVDAVKPPRSAAHTPIFQAMFGWQQAGEGGLAPDGLQVSPLLLEAGTSKVDLTLNLADTGERIVGSIEYATALFDAATVQRHAACLRELFRGMVEEALAVECIPLLAAEDRERLVCGRNRTAVDLPRDRGVHALFEEQAARSPEALAVVHAQRRVSYAELDAMSNRLAHRLTALGVRAGERVAVLLERSVELVAAELAVLKCGAAFVPLDMNAPLERLGFMLQDSSARLVLTASAHRLPERDGLIRLDLDIVKLDTETAGSLPRRGDGESTAYVMYTSGSTGTPKGVVVPHRGIARIALQNGYAAFDASDRVAFAANPAFDATTMEVWAALLNGGAIVVIDNDTLFDAPALAEQLQRDGVTAMFVTTALFNQYALSIPKALAGLKYLLCGGERNDPASFARVLREGGPQHLIHCYGPTETTTFALACDINDVPEGATNLPIGRPIANTTVYVLDRHMQPVPVGVAGEIYIGGTGVALGYLNRPELTAERFVASPFVPGEMLYKTGDLARWMPDGLVEFIGRNDFQVKIRGFRIELGEIEAQILRHPGVRETIVLAREDQPGDKRLVAYCTTASGVATPLQAEALRAQLLSVLPEHMVPAAFVVLESLPLTPNGKVDRKALPAPDAAAYATREYEAPDGDIEERLALAWSETLMVDRIGRRDDFFDLGGHSLLMTRLIVRIEHEFGVRLEVQEFFRRPTLAAMAEWIVDAQLAQFSDDDIEALLRQEP